MYIYISKEKMLKSITCNTNNCIYLYVSIDATILIYLNV